MKLTKSSLWARAIKVSSKSPALKFILIYACKHCFQTVKADKASAW